MKRNAVTTFIIAISCFILGIFAAVGLQFLPNMSRADDAPHISYSISDEAMEDFKQSLQGFQAKHGLKDEQVAWIISKNGFSGFYPPIMQKGSVILGTNYNSASWGEKNQLLIGGENRVLGPRTAAQIAVIDTKNGEVQGVIDLKANASDQLDFVVFTPDAIKQFRMNTVLGTRYERKWEASTQ